MKDLSPTARELLELGRDAGEPDDAALARGRAALMMRVGAATAAAATVTTFSTLATTAKAASLPAAVAPCAVATGAAASGAVTTSALATGVAATAPLASSIPLVAAPVVVKLAAVPIAVKVAAVAVAVGVSVGAATTIVQSPPRSPVVVEAPAARVEVAARPAEPVRATPRAVAAPVEVFVPPEPEPAAEAEPSPAPPVAAPAPAPVARSVAACDVPGPGLQPAPPTAPVGEAPALTGPSLAEDVAALRAAQAALVAGNPAAALEAVGRVRPDGPLADEREGVRILATCAMGAPDARLQAERFVARRPQAPVALRIRAACLGEK